MSESLPLTREVARRSRDGGRDNENYPSVNPAGLTAPLTRGALTPRHSAQNTRHYVSFETHSAYFYPYPHPPYAAGFLFLGLFFEVCFDDLHIGGLQLIQGICLLKALTFIQDALVIQRAAGLPV